MANLLLPIVALLSGIALLLLGSGLLTTLIALRGALEGFSPESLGLIGSAYFFGFFLGTFVAPRLIRRTGHIRAFAFFGVGIAVTVLMHALIVDPALWFVLRLLTGIALVGFYTVIESWLNSETHGGRRAKIFAIYMVVNLGALAAAQQLLQIASPAGFALFAIAAIFACLSVMPVALTRFAPPELHDAPHPDVRKLWRVAPLAFVGACASGLGMGAFWTMAPVYGQQIGLEQGDVGLLMTLAILGGAVAQWPVGYFSDRHDRRRTLGWVAAAAAGSAALMIVLGQFGAIVLVGAFLFGAAGFAVYPLVIAHLIDHLPHGEILAGNAGILLLHGLAAAFGPALAGALMGVIGPGALPLHFFLAFAPLAVFGLWQARRRADEIVEEPAHCVPMLRTSPTVLELMNPDGDDPAAPQGFAPD